MRIHGDFHSFRPMPRRRAALLGDNSHLATSLFSRPKASSHDVPQRPRQVSKSEMSTRSSNPQWMKTLEEKFHKLHVKIDSYPQAGFRGNQFPPSYGVGIPRYNWAQKTSNKPLPNKYTLNRPVDLVRLGKSVLRYAKTRRYSEQRSKATRPYGEAHSPKTNQPGNQSVSAVALCANSTITIPPTTDDSHGLSEGYEDYVGRSNLHVGAVRTRPYYCDTQSLLPDGNELGADNPKGDIHGTATGSPVTDSGFDLPGLYDDCQLPLTDRHGDRRNQGDVVETRAVATTNGTYLDTIARAFSPSPSCFSHPSTYKSSWRPKSSQAASESASYRVHKNIRPRSVKMPRNGRKTSEAKRINVLLGMSEEARYAISETKKEMGSQPKSVLDNGLGLSDGDGESNNNNNRRGRLHYSITTSDNLISSKGQDLRNDTAEGDCTDIGEGDGVGTGSNMHESVPSSASVNTTIGEDSNSRNMSVTSVAQEDGNELSKRLPALSSSGVSGAKSLNYLQVRQHNGLSADSRHKMLRNISREKTFQITPPDYDVRFREILTCEIPESETPPADIKAQAVAKCSEWLNKRYITNFRGGKENVS
ncbi:uncharacterized protein LOC135477845 [Liolophura sinensis]|uniref:uncharacterized protein LOC135477845 n=1 Tax=Liolophura sinensis TaxID=3198878 RepID=UPI003158BC6D